MSGLENHDHNQAGAIADPIAQPANNSPLPASTGSAQSADQTLDASLNQAFSPGDHNHAPPPGAGNFELHTSLDNVAVVKQLNRGARREVSFIENIGRRGDLMVLGGGDNVAIGSGSADVIDTRGGRLNTITTGSGKDTIILGAETTNRIFDFDPANDRLVIDTKGLDMKNIVVAQGKNAGRAGVDQPLDSANNAMVIDKATGHILASMPFIKAEQLLDSKTIVQMTNLAQKSLDVVRFDNVQQGDGQLTGTRGRDRMTGGGGNDFLYVGDDGFKFNTAKGGGGTEFPFATDSPGTSELNAELKNGVLRVNGTYKDFDGAPLFSQGEQVIDPKARILNGSNPQALVEGFLRVPKDVEGNPISGTHLHFSPAGDNRGNFADATVVRFFENTPTDAKSGTIKGEFELNPVEQAALLAGNMYVNIHTNMDVDGDGRAGFPTGENRVNLNRNVVQFT
ncbi:CHRD domain-containing protein [Leptolyngbya ohadii]|uniref:CHRD domain-containing protein n=1 Tax=Leptolyngbya ohadii TaxID=1962290 RepID=UPI000B59CB70|nr:CHRD domain-containing protein [Leptolyngbya ohadii]